MKLVDNNKKIIIIGIVLLFSIAVSGLLYYKMIVYKDVSKNSLKEDIMYFQTASGEFQTYRSINPLYNTFHSLVILEHCVDNISNISELERTKEWLQMLRIDEILKDSTTIPDIYYYVKSCNILDVEISKEITTALITELDLRYQADGFFTYKTNNLEVKNNRLFDAANRSMTSLAVEIADILGCQEIYDRDKIINLAKEASCVYENALFQKMCAGGEEIAYEDVILLNYIYVLSEIGVLLNESTIENPVKLTEYLVWYWENIDDISFDSEEARLYQLTGTCKLSSLLGVTVQKEWVQEVAMSLLKSGDLYTLDQTIGIMVDNDINIDSITKKSIMNEIVGGIQYNGSITLHSEKNELYTDIENSYSSYKLLKMYDCTINKRYKTFLKEAYLNRFSLNCVDRIHLYEMMAQENLIEEIPIDELVALLQETENMIYGEKIRIYYELSLLLETIDLHQDILEKYIELCIIQGMELMSSTPELQEILLSYQLMLYSRYPCVWDETQLKYQKEKFVQYFENNFICTYENMLYNYYMLKMIYDLGWENDVNIDKIYQTISNDFSVYKVRNLYTTINHEISLPMTYYVYSIYEYIQ